MHVFLAFLFYITTKMTLYFKIIFRTNNPVLLQLGLSLMSFLDEPRVHVVLYRMISESPDLWYPFFAATPLELDPKPTLKWLNQIKLVNSVSLCFVFKFFSDLHVHVCISSVHFTLQIIITVLLKVIST